MHQALAARQQGDQESAKDSGKDADEYCIRIFQGGFWMKVQQNWLDLQGSCGNRFDMSVTSTNLPK